jgi:hypothetical protein
MAYWSDRQSAVLTKKTRFLAKGMAAAEFPQAIDYARFQTTSILPLPTAIGLL